MSESLDWLIAHERSYKASSAVAEQLQDITMIYIVGPAAIGKSTCIDEIIQLNPDFGKVISFTTRPLKTGEIAGQDKRILPNNESTLRDLVAAASHGELVQYAVHQTTGNVYGSVPGDYNKPYMMLDTLSSFIERLSSVPFKRTVKVTLAADPSVWVQRFKQMGFEGEDALKRIEEGRQSINWSLNQGDSMIWVDNSSDGIEPAAREVMDIVVGKRKPNSQNRKIGEKLLEFLNSQQLTQ